MAGVCGSWSRDIELIPKQEAPDDQGRFYLPYSDFVAIATLKKSFLILRIDPFTLSYEFISSCDIPLGVHALTPNDSAKGSCDHVEKGQISGVAGKSHHNATSHMYEMLLTKGSD